MTDPDDIADFFLSAYRQGLFPMADNAGDADFYWVEPKLRGQLPILDLHIPQRLERTVLRAPYRITVDRAFDQVVFLCADSVPGRAQTWINGPIARGFSVLHRRGMAHSVECWDGNRLVGGLYGLALGGVFCGESMASRARDASKIALVHLCARLWRAGFTVLDTQFVNDHLKQFGVYEISQAAYLRRLSAALSLEPDFHLSGDPLALDSGALLAAYLSARATRALPSGGD